MNILIIEDEKLSAERLLRQIQQYNSTIKNLAFLSSVRESVEWIQNHLSGISINADQIDLIFMDIHLDDGDCFKIISQLNLKIPIVFTTAFDEHMVKAFKVNSVDYLLKPINYNELVGAIEKFRSLKDIATLSTVPLPEYLNNLGQLLAKFDQSSTEEHRDRFLVAVGSKLRVIRTSDIAFFYSKEKVVYLTTVENSTLPIDYSLDKIEKMVNPRDFFRVNRQFIISADCIKIVHNYATGKFKIELFPDPKAEVLVSGDRLTEFKDWLGK